MIDDIIKALKLCRTKCFKECPYYNIEKCRIKLSEDILDILENQKPELILRYQKDMKIGSCPKCKYTLSRYMHYCPICGKAILWN